MLLNVQNLHCFAPGRIEIVRGLNLSLEEGEVLGIVGESGSGKTMTMRSLMGILPEGVHAEADSILFDGQDLTKLNEVERRKIRGRSLAMVFQDPMTSLNPLRKIGFHLEEVLTRSCDLSKHDAAKEALSLLKRVGITEPESYLKRYPHELSGGMRQRVLIAMALACKPKLLIADEPTTALDVTIQAQILALIKELQAETGMAVALITHDLGVVAGLCRRVVVMYAGMILEDAPVDELFAAPLHPYTRALLNAAPSLDEARGRRLESIPGFPPSFENPPSGCPFAPRCSLAQKACTEKLPPLEGEEHKTRCQMKNL
jgi:oligopeptide/dipeptide ABC transporter ATP-binding protein